MAKWPKAGPNVQTSRCQTSKSWGRGIQHGDILVNIVCLPVAKRLDL